MVSPTGRGHATQGEVGDDHGHRANAYNASRPARGSPEAGVSALGGLRGVRPVPRPA